MGAAISYLQVEVLTYDALLFACCCVCTCGCGCAWLSLQETLAWPLHMLAKNMKVVAFVVQMKTSSIIFDFKSPLLWLFLARRHR